MSTPQIHTAGPGNEQEKQEWATSPARSQYEGAAQASAFPGRRSRGTEKTSIAQLCSWVVDHQIGQDFNVLPMTPYLSIHRHCCNPTLIASRNSPFLPECSPSHFQILPNLLLQSSHREVCHRLGRSFIRVFLDHRLVGCPLRDNGLHP